MDSGQQLQCEGHHATAASNGGRPLRSRGGQLRKLANLMNVGCPEGAAHSGMAGPAAAARTSVCCATTNSRRPSPRRPRLLLRQGSIVCGASCPMTLPRGVAKLRPHRQPRVQILPQCTLGCGAFQRSVRKVSSSPAERPGNTGSAGKCAPRPVRNRRSQARLSRAPAGCAPWSADLPENPYESR